MLEQPHTLNPATIALTSAEDLVLGNHLDNDHFTPYEHQSLDRLRQLASELNFLNQPYCTTAERSLLVPAGSSHHDTMTLVEFQSLNFEGEFDDYAVIKTLRSVGHGAIRTLCLSFRAVILTKNGDRDKVPDNTRLQVPVFAVTQINKLH